MIREAVPSKVKELLEDQQLNGVPVLLSTTSDLSLGGEQAGHWIVVTRDNLAVVAEGQVGDGEPRLVSHVPISSVSRRLLPGSSSVLPEETKCRTCERVCAGAAFRATA